LVDADNDIINIFKQSKPSYHRFKIIKGEVYELKKTNGTISQFIANDASWRLKKNKPGCNKKIFEAAGKEFEVKTTLYYPNPGVVGEVYPVPVPKSSDLFQNEGVGIVIHIVSPNADKNKPDAIEDEEKALKMLSTCYSNLFACFIKLQKLYEE